MADSTKEYSLDEVFGPKTEEATPDPNRVMSLDEVFGPAPNATSQSEKQPEPGYDKSGVLGSAEAIGSGLAEGYAGLKGFEAGTSVGTKVGEAMSDVPYVKYAAPIAPIAGGLIGMAVANRAAKGVEDVAGVKQSIDEAQSAHPYETMGAQLLPMGGQAINSVGNILNIAKTNVPKALGKVAVGAGVGAGLVYPQHLADTAVANITGGQAPEAPGTSDYLMGAGLGGVLGSVEHKPAVNPFKKIPSAEIQKTAQDLVDTGSPETGKALLEVDAQRPEVPETAPVSSTAPVTEPTATTEGSDVIANAISTPENKETAAPKVSDGAVNKADELGIDIEQVPANKFGRITAADVVKYHASLGEETKVEPVKTEEQQTDKELPTTEVPENTSEEQQLNEELPTAETPELISEGEQEPPLSSADEPIQQAASDVLETPAVEPTVEAEKPTFKVTDAAQKLIDAKGVDITKLTPNKQGNVTTREVQAHLKANPIEQELQSESDAIEPQLTEQQESETQDNGVTNEEPQSFLPTEPVIEPHDVVSEYPGVNTQSISSSTAFNIRSNTDKPVPVKFAVSRLGSDAHKILKDFVNRLHAPNNPKNGSQPGLLPGKVTGEVHDAVSLSGDKGVPVTFTRYPGNLDFEHLRAIAAIEARASGTGGTIFKRRAYGEHTLFQIDTKSQNLNFIADQLQKAGLDKIVLSVNPTDGNVTVTALSLEKGADADLLGKLKQFAYENNYGKIEYYKGYGEQVSSDPSAQEATIKESLGRLSSGGGTGGAGTDSVRLANSLWELAREAGIQGIGNRPAEYVAPGEKTPKYIKLAKKLSKLRDTIPDARRKDYDARIENAKRDLAKVFGIKFQPSMWDEAKGKYVPSRKINEDGSYNGFTVSPAEFLPSTWNAAQTDQNYKPYPSYSGLSTDLRETAWEAGVDRVALKLAEYAKGDVVKPKKNTEGNLKNRQRLEDAIDSLLAKEGELDDAEKETLEELEGKLDRATNQIDPWVLDRKGLARYAQNGSQNHIITVKSAAKTAAKNGFKPVSLDDFAEGGDGESGSLLDKEALRSGALAPEEVTPEEPDVRESLSDNSAYAIKFASDPTKPVEDRLAVVRKLWKFAKAKKDTLRPEDIEPLTSMIATLAKSATEKQIAAGDMLSRNFTMGDLLNGKHRTAEGKLIRGADKLKDMDKTMYRMSEESSHLPEENVPGVTDALTKDFGGKLPPNVSVIHDPSQQWSARLQGDKIMVNAAYTHPEEASLYIDHEVGHVLWQDKGFHGMFDTLWNSLPEESRNSIDQTIEELYSHAPEDEQHEERRVRALELIRDESMKTEQGKNAWDKLVEYVKRFWNKLTGAEGSYEDRVAELAARMVEYGRAKTFGLETEIDNQGIRYRKAPKISQAMTGDEFQDLAPDAAPEEINSRTSEQSQKEAADFVNQAVKETGSIRGAYDKLSADPYQIHNQAAPKAFLILAKLAKDKLADYAGRTDLTAKEIVERNIASDTNVNALKSSRKLISGFASGLNAAKSIPDFVEMFAKGVLGKSVRETAMGKGLDTEALVDHIKQSFRDAAAQTLKDYSVSLEKFGLNDDMARSTLEQVLGHTDTSRKDLTDALRTLTGEDPSVPLLAKEIESRFNRNLAAKTRPMRLTPEIARYARFASFDEHGLYGAALDSLGVKNFDSAFANEIRERVAEIEKLPEGSSPRLLLTARLNGDIGNKIIASKFQKGFWQGSGQALLLLPEIFRTAILTGPPTLLTHGLSGFVNSRLEGAYSSLGHFANSLNAGNSFAESLGFFRDFMDSMILSSHGDLGNSSLRNFGRVIRTGEGAFNLAEGRGRRGLDAYAAGGFGNGAGARTFQTYAGAMAYLPRLLGAFDELNSGTALDLNQRMATRAALLNQGVRGNDAAEAMRKAFAPTKEELEVARQQLDDEVDKGFFKGLNTKDEFYTMADRLQQLHLEGQLPDSVLGKEEDLRKLSKNWTLKGEPKGIPGYISGMLATANKTTKISTFFTPFTNIIAALMNNSLDYTPLGFLKAQNASISNFLLPTDSIYAHDKFTKGSPEQIALMAKSVLGTTVGMFLTSWFLRELHEEELTGKPPAFTFYGDGPRDTGKRKQMEDGGWRAGTIKIGDQYIPYKAIPGLDLLGTALGTLHDYVKYEMPLPKIKHGMRYTDEQIQQAHQLGGDKLFRCALAVAISPLQHHFLSGMRNLIEIMHDPQGPGGPRAAVNQLVGSISQVTDPQIFRVVRNTLGKDNTGEVPTLDLTSPMGEIAQFVPFFSGYNTVQLNVLGDPIYHNPKDPLISRWLLSAKATPDPIITPLVNSGLFIPPPLHSTAIQVDNQGNMSNLKEAGQDAWRAYQIYRGQFLKKVLSPALVQRLTSMRTEDAQQFLNGPSIATAASKIARIQVENDIRRGKIKVNKV